MSEWLVGMYLYIFHCKKKTLVALATEWLPWLPTSWGESGYIIDISGYNCISNLGPNQLTTLRTSVRESLQLHFKKMTLSIKAGDFLADVQ